LNKCVVLDGEVAVPCNLQSAIAGLNALLRQAYVKLPQASDDDNWVLRNGNL